MLIDSKGKNKGIVKIDIALSEAQSLSLDLVQVSPSGSNPVVCKIFDFGKHLFTKKKNNNSVNQKLEKAL